MGVCGILKEGHNESARLVKHGEHGEFATQTDDISGSPLICFLTCKSLLSNKTLWNLMDCGHAVRIPDDESARQVRTEGDMTRLIP